MRILILCTLLSLLVSLLEIHAANAAIILARTVPECGKPSQAFLQRAHSLLELSDIALSCNPNTQLGWAQTKAALANIGLAQSPYWPQISGEFAINAQGSLGNTGDDDNDNGSHRVSYNPSLTISYLIWDFGTTHQRVKAATFEYQAARLNLDETMQQVIFGVQQAYYLVLGQRALVEANQHTVKEAKVSLDAAHALHHQGLVTIGDVYQAESILSQAELALQQTQGNLDNARGQLAVAVGMPVQTPFKLVELPEQVKVQPVLDRLEHWLDLAQKKRPDLLAAKSQVYAAQAQLNAAKTQYLPTLQISANSGRVFPNANTLGLDNNVLLTINVPIFTGFANYYGIKQANAVMQQAQAEQAILSQQVALQVWQAYFTLQTALKELKTSEVFLKSSQAAANQTYGQYRAGVGDIVAMLNAQSTLASARAQNIQAKLNWYIGLAQFFSALGTLTPNTERQ